MSKMAPMVGKEITERYFLGQFDNLCSDPLFHVRKVTNHVYFLTTLHNPTLASTVLSHYRSVLGALVKCVKSLEMN